MSQLECLCGECDSEAVGFGYSLVAIWMGSASDVIISVWCCYNTWQSLFLFVLVIRFLKWLDLEGQLELYRDLNNCVR